MIYPGLDAKMVIILLCSPLVSFAIHALLARVSSGSPQVIAFRAAVIGYIPIAAFLWIFVFRENKPTYLLLTAVIYSFIVYSSLAYTYFHFFNMSETARRIKILFEIYRHGSMRAKDLTALYKTSDIISIRLKRLSDMGQLECKEGFFSIKGGILYWAAHMILLWRKMLALQEDSNDI